MPRVVHFEIHAGDPARAQHFFGELFGWTFSHYAGPWDYWLVTTGPDSQPGINGGLLRRMGDIDGQSVIAYVCTVDVTCLDNTVAKAQEPGGAVALPRTPIPGIGWLAYLKDTEGNNFGVMESDPAAK